MPLPETAPDRDPRGPWRRWPLVVLLAGLVVTAAGVAATWRVYENGEERLLEQQTREAGAVLTAAIARIETAIGSSAELADATNADPVRFTAYGARLAERHGFSGLELRHTDGSTLATTGPGELLGPRQRPDLVDRLVADAAAAPGSIAVGLVDGPERRMGYAATSTSPRPFVVYTETDLPDRPEGLSQTDGPFSDIEYAIYLEGQPSDDLLFSTASELPMPSGHADVSLPLGDRSIRFTARASEPLAGRFAQFSPWLLALGGTLVSVLAALGTRSVIRRGRAAAQLAAALRDITDEQRRGIATLRQSLLPRTLQSPPGLELQTGYWPADRDHEISGDFYDAFQVDERRWAVVIGDVCGKGTEAAALTGVTRHTIRAAARHLRSPADVLRWTHEAIAAYGADTYVTVCFAFVDLDRDGDGADRISVTMSLGGHPRPALWRDGHVELVGQSGTILGLLEPQLRTSVVRLTPGDVLVLYTDGLTDNASAPLDDAGLIELLTSTLADCDPDGCADAIHAALQQHRPTGSADDTAALLLRVVGPDVETNDDPDPAAALDEAVAGAGTGDAR